MKHKVSVIVPVYNVEEYLPQCVESIINQDCANKELVLVDDGSPDNCPNICDEYAEKYDFIRVVHKENGGLSDARNAGIREATGDYVLFVDADDFIEPGSISVIMEVAERSFPDVVFLEAQKYFPDGSTAPLGDGIKEDAVRGKSAEEVLRFLGRSSKFPGSACTKLIKRELLSDELLFEKGRLSEDIDWSIRLLLKAKSYDYCGAVYYNYRKQRAGSITNTAGLKSFRDVMYILKNWSEKAKGETDANKRFIYATLAYEYSILVMLYSKLSREDKKFHKKELKELLWLLDWRRGARYSGVKKLCKLAGFGITSRLLRLYLKTRGKK